ncbi:MAG: TetR/AcrR family transcriptional regulator [Acidimicrobiia bacterium]
MTGGGLSPAGAIEHDQPLGRVARKRIRRINEILRVAAEVLGERGYQGTSLEEVADRLDLAKASLYHYFDSKEALFSACLEAAAEEVIGRLSAIAAGEGSARGRLRRLIVEQIRFTTYEAPELSRLFLRHLEWPESISEKIHDWQTRHDAVFKQVIEEGCAAGELQVAVGAVARQCLIGAVNSVPFWGYKPDGRYSVEGLVDEVADTVMGMFGAAPAPG